MSSTTDETVKFANGKISRKIPRFELIPRAAAIALALRYERGIRTKGEGAWNALTDPAGADDKQFVIDRLAHCIDHCLKAIERLHGLGEPISEESANDGGDAGAIMFAGALLACHVVRVARVAQDVKPPSNDMLCTCGHVLEEHSASCRHKTRVSEQGDLIYDPCQCKQFVCASTTEKGTNKRYKLVL